MSKIKILDTDSYITGMDEIAGLREAIEKVLNPVKDIFQSHVYWDDLKYTDREYKPREGFIPYSHNKGGLELTLHVPKCEEYNFDFLDFGTCDGCFQDGPECCADHGGECLYDMDGHLDAFLRVALKFEGLHEGELKFYIFVEGGNNDAPYFRSKYLPTLFEAEFTAKSVRGVPAVASKHVKKILKLIKGKK